MAESIQVYGFGDNDRSGKVRWTARELGLTVEDVRLRPGEHRQPPYAEMNPYQHVPTAVFRGETLLESTAICHTLADAFDDPKLFVARGEPERNAYLYWLAVFGETLEARLVECAVSRAGLLGPEYFALHEASLRRKLGVVASQLPAEGYLAGARFTVADVLAGYGLRLALGIGLVERARVEPYLGRLVARPAAIEARVFASL
ncbi:MAG: glutathione S-transferase family protein [Polyangiaceae bacterium]